MKRFGHWLAEQELIYALGVRTGTTVWWGEHQPVAAPIIGKRGKTKTHLTRDEHHQPISVLTLARTFAPQRFRSVTWRQGTSEPLRSRFARVRVRAAHRDAPREEEWLVIEWPKDEAAYGFLMRERLSRAKKNAGQFAEPALPEGFRPRGATTDATPRPELDPHIALPPRSCHRKRLAAMSMLREISK